MRLEDFKGADAVELLADVMVPLSHIYSDDNIKKMWREGKKSIAEVASYALKTHKVYVLDIYEKYRFCSCKWENILYKDRHFAQLYIHGSFYTYRKSLNEQLL